MPLTTAGKVDRRACPAAERANRRRAPGHADRKVDRRHLARRARGRFGRREDDFFDLGGHSLHATRVISRIGRALGVDLPLRALFDAPTVRGLARRVEASSQASSTAIARAEESERRRASFAQSRLWFLDRLEPESAAYNIAGAMRLRGPLDHGALEAALAQVIARHETLRSTFHEEAGEPIVRVEPTVAVTIAVEPISGGEEADALARAAELARLPFDLARGPLYRTRLFRLSAEDHLLAFALHHIAADGWSIGLLIEEWTRAYRAQLEGGDAKLPALRVQYGDWAAWQRARLRAGAAEGGALARQLDSWREALEGLPALQLPTDLPRPARPTSRGAAFPVELDLALTAALEARAREEGVTLHMLLLAAFAALLGRWSGQRDLGIGTPVANRTVPEAEALIGVFINTLVVRARWEDDATTFRQLLGQVRESTLAAYANQEAPFEEVVAALDPTRDLARTPLFQAMFILQNAPTARFDLGAVRAERVELPAVTSNFDLTLSLEVEEEGARALRGELEYSTELFHEETPRRLFEHWRRFLESVSRDPELEIARVPLLSPTERTRALEVSSGAGALRPSPLSLPERIADQARRWPERIAALLGHRRLSYGQLDERAARLARALVERGVGPEVRVGLLLDRSPEYAVAMLAVWKAGGAAVPLDPDHPRDRLGYALEDCGAALVLTTEAYRGIAEESTARPLLLDDEANFAAEPLAPRALAMESLAYCIYTSGTTGRPKGAMVSHRALADAYLAWERLYGLGEIASHLQMASAGFDVSIGDLTRALGSGATLVFCPRERLLDPAALFELFARERVEFAEFVPAVLRGVAAHARKTGQRLESAKVIAIGSDVWTSAEIDAFRATFGPRTRLANSYGVTEATIDSTCWFLADAVKIGAAPPIGSPLTHATVYVLDEQLEPTPPGVLGELYLGGPGVARGYHARPDLTAERFVPDPFGPSGARLYRTGDRARYLASGEVTFAGRGDDQVKIRGQRVELAEIEAALRASTDVVSCAVVVKESSEGTRLAAYLVPRAMGDFDPAALRETMRARLPDAWLPSAFVALEALPLTPNGKVDRRRLPEPEWSFAAEYEPPRGAREEAVAAAFAEVLGRAQVGATDDFFSLGGHSLLAVRVISALRATLESSCRFARSSRRQSFASSRPRSIKSRALHRRSSRPRPAHGSAPPSRRRASGSSIDLNREARPTTSRPRSPSRNARGGGARASLSALLAA
ncbi:MAG: amino acid adenylation domain-containing protein [Candidatus Eisenbacteria bacterium]